MKNESENIGLSERMSRSKEFNVIIEKYQLWGENLTNEQIVSEIDSLRTGGKEIPITNEETAVRAKWETTGGKPEAIVKKDMEDAESNEVKSFLKDEERKDMIEFLRQHAVPNLDTLDDSELVRFKENIEESIGGGHNIAA